MITSGSQGSKGLNGKLIQFLKMVKNASYEVLVVTGKNNYEEFTTENQFSKNVKIIPYLDNMAAFFKNCDLVIGRSGAGTVCELLASHTPSILIPSPNVANNHQYYNALGVEEAKMAIMIEEKDLDSQNLYQKVNSLLKGDDEYQTLKNNLNKYQKPNASEKIYKSIKEIVKNV